MSDTIVKLTLPAIISMAVTYPVAYQDVNYGTKISVATLNEDIYSTMPGNTYEYATGTSVATPFITVITALILPKTIS